MGPAAFKAVEGSLTRLLVGSIPIHSRWLVERQPKELGIELIGVLGLSEPFLYLTRKG